MNSNPSPSNPFPSSLLKFLLVASLLPIAALICGTLLVIYSHPLAASFPFALSFLTLPSYRASVPPSR